MASVPADSLAHQSVLQYIRSFARALPRLRSVVTGLNRWDRITFDPRKESEARAGQVSAQIFVGAIALIHLVTAARMMRRVLRHHCRTYSMATEDCPAVGLASAIIEREGGEHYSRALDAAVAYQPSDYRPAYARALQFEDEGNLRGAEDEYRAMALLPRAGPYCLLRAGSCAKGRQARPAYEKAAQLYPGFALATRKLAETLQESDALLAANHYLDALSRYPELEYGEQGWAGRRGSVEIELYRGFRIYLVPEARRYAAFPVLLGSDDKTIQRRTWPFWSQFIGLALLRLHKDQILKRFRRPPRSSPSPATEVTARNTTTSKWMRAARGRILGWLIKGLWYCEHRLRHWTGRHLHYARFGLIGHDLQDVKRQIDWIYTNWMFDGPLDSRVPVARPTR